MIYQKYYAHTTESRDKATWQPLKTHLVNVAEIASRFATDFNGEEYAYAAGILHDLGKYSNEFQDLLDGASIKVDHSTAGALEARARYSPFHCLILGYVITGHHAGLMDYGSKESGLKSRFSKNIPDYSRYGEELMLPDLDGVDLRMKGGNNSTGFIISFFIRMLFSCLVDADSLDTEQFCNPDRASLRGAYDNFDTLREMFDEHMAKIRSKADANEINQYRDEVFNECLKMGRERPQLFSLTVPTGGGKTLASMAFALEQVRNHDLNRIIYVIPYTSIIEQTAGIFKEIFGERNVLEHHSNFDPEGPRLDDNHDYEYSRLSMENWDAPIIVTTNVQFFESLFSNKRSRCRKIHNVSRSVIIFDEAQMIPTNYLLPCLAAVTELVRNYGSSAVMCTATQPKFADLLDVDDRPKEIIKSPIELYEAFRRVTLKNLGEVDDEDLSAMLKAGEAVLCIVNTRNHARALYDSLSELDGTFHLSARMCPTHRSEVLDVIKKRLGEKHGPCRVISTPLIEAGVDIDFPIVYRAMSGIDSIAQAAGRCNREGRSKCGEVNVFRSSGKYGHSTPWQSRAAENGEKILEGGGDTLSLENISAFFHLLYHYEGDEGLDNKKILKLLEEGGRRSQLPFEDVSDRFCLIEQVTKDVIIPYDGKAQLYIEELRASKYPWKYMRKLQRYVVSIYEDEFRELMSSRSIDIINDQFFVLNDMEKYCPKTGLLNSKYNKRESPLLYA